MALYPGMADPDAASDGTRFRVLDDGAAVDEERLAGLYGYPTGLSGPWVRANVIAALDGGAVSDGKSGGLGGPGDRQVFGVLRELADVILVGAGTARTETYSGARMSAGQRQARHRRSQPEVPPIALVTRSAALDRDLPVLTDTEVPPLVLTCADAADGARRRLGAAAVVLDCSAGDPGRVDMAAALARLAERGLLRVLTEGGPTLLGALIGADLLDEMCLTVAPVLVGGDGPRVTAGGAEVLSRMRRAHLLADTDGYLYGRYTRAR